MAILSDSTFDYEVTLAAQETELWSGLTGRAGSLRAPDRPCLLGPHPEVRLVQGSLVLSARPEDRPRFWRPAGPQGARARGALVAVGPLLDGLIAAGDVLRVAYDMGGGLGLSLSRKGALVLGLGDLAGLLPLGLGPHGVVEQISEPEDDTERALELRVAGQALHLDEGEHTTVGPYTLRLHLCTETRIPSRRIRLSVARLSGGLSADAVSFTAGALCSGGIRIEAW